MSPQLVLVALLLAGILNYQYLIIFNSQCLITKVPWSAVVKDGFLKTPDEIREVSLLSALIACCVSSFFNFFLYFFLYFFLASPSPGVLQFCSSVAL